MCKKKILHIVEAMGGGVFTYIVDLANEQIKEYDVFIAYAVRAETPENYIEYFDKRVHLIQVENFVRTINLKKDIKAVREIKAIANKISPNIIHLHSSKAGVIGRIAFNGNKIPLFYTPHGYSFLMQNYSFFKRRIFKFIEVICAKRQCLTICCGKGEFQQSLKFTKHTTYVNNAINVDKIPPIFNDINVEKHSFIVFTLGRICYQKNPMLFNQIAEAMPNIKFLWIGDGELRNELRAVNIEITGWINREEALKRSKNADVFILTSLWEGLPMSLLEAMYMKKVCIVNDIIGCNDVIKNGENGFVCSSTEDFIKCIETVQERDSKTLVNNAFADVCRLYNTKVQAEAYSKIYLNSLKRREI